MEVRGKRATWSVVEIVNITNKDGSELAPDNWRRKNIGIVTGLTFAGGFKSLMPFFEIKVCRNADGEIQDIDLGWTGNASPGYEWPVEVAPDVFDFATQTSIYRFRVIDKKSEEGQALNAAVVRRARELYAAYLSASIAGGGTVS